MLLLLSWKNIWRNKTRSCVIIIAIIVGVIGGVGLTAFFEGLLFQRIEIAIGNEVSNIQIHNADYLNNRDISDTIADIEHLSAQLGACKKVKAFSSRLKLVAMIQSANSNEGILLTGIKPEEEIKVTNIHRYIRKGSYFKDDKQNGMLIGQKLATKLRVKLRSKVVITAQTISGNIIYAAFKITGIYETENSTFDGRNVFVRKDEMSRMIGINKNASHELVISSFNDNQTDSLAKSFTALVTKNTNIVQTWKEIMPELALFTQVAAIMLYILMGIIFLALSFGVINTMLMAVLERVREIGMLMAIGMSKGKIFRMILLETILLMFTGAVIGMILAFLLVSYFSRHGIDLSSISSGLSGFGMSSEVFPVLPYKAYLEIVVMVLITGLISSLIPARRALKFNPSEAIRKL